MMKTLHCAACHRKLAELKSGHAVLTIKCGRCKGVNVFDTRKELALA